MSIITSWVTETPARDATEQRTFAVFGFIIVLLVVGVLTGVVGLCSLLSRIVLVGMYTLLSLGLNVQWSYVEFINFSATAFWGIGMYCAVLLVALDSPLGLEPHPVFGFLGTIVMSTLIAAFIGTSMLHLRENYLATAGLGLAEVIRVIILNEDQWTAGSRGISGALNLLLWLPLTDSAMAAVVMVVLIAAVYLSLRRVRRPQRRHIPRTTWSDEDPAKALGKNTYRPRVQASVLGPVIMAVVGALYVHLNLYINPSGLVPLMMLRIWIAVIFGGTGSNHGAITGAVAVIVIHEGIRFLNDVGSIQTLDIDLAPLRLLSVGEPIILIMRFRQDGLLPPEDELTWPTARDGSGADGVFPSGVASDGGIISNGGDDR